MSHEMPLSTIVFQKPNGETGELNVHDTDAIHNEEGSVTSTNLAASAVHTEDIASQAVTSDKLADNSVQTANIENGAVTEDKLSQEFRDSISQYLYTVRGHNVTFTNIPGNSYQTQKLNCTETEGFVPVAIAGYQLQQSNMNIVDLIIQNNQITAIVRNRETIQMSTTLYVSVLYLRRKLV